MSDRLDLPASSAHGGCFCMRCGTPIPWWSDEPDALLSYEAWLELRCIKCGTTPRENGAK